MFSLVQLRVFATAARVGSFTAAAMELHMAQPSVSEFVRRLEDEYGTRLFVRGGRRLVLTEAGETLLPVAVKVTTSADEADRTLRAITSLEGGTASFGLLRNAKYYRLEELLAQFHERYPSVRLRIVGLNSVEVAGAVADGELEAGLVVLPIDADGLTVTPLRRDEVLYASADPARALHPPTIEDLAARKLVLYDAHYGWRDPTRRQVLERASLAGVHLDAMVEVEQVESALTLVAAGVGDTFVSRAVAESGACPPQVRFVPFAEPLHDTIALVQRDGATLSPATAELVRLALALLQRTA
ncbi:LysR family transcriptional regulator [uncultured Amnibacterium sp.]|uniref:LysR family transcriptional regulator n=1 Tax=uncultured Amnibacterium sp. TaxID=1631851 RepID=UPI0035CCA358